MKGFTLIELLTVVSIIAVLSAIAIPQYTKSINRSRVAGYETNLSAILQSAKSCQEENPDGSVCTDMTDIDVRIPSCDTLPGHTSCSYGLSKITFQGEEQPLAYVHFSGGLYFILDGFGHKLCIGEAESCKKFGFGTSQAMSGYYINGIQGNRYSEQ